MTTLTLENVPDDLVERLRRSAERHGRSLSGEAVTYLERSVPTVDASLDAERFLAEVRELRSRLNVPPLTDEFLDRAINEGRP